MEVDTSELLHRIGSVLRVISDKMDRLIAIGERVEGEVRLPAEKELKTVADVLRNDTCIPSDAVADEPPKKWRRLTDEFVQPGDWANAKVNRQDVDPPDGGWIPADPCYFGRRACTLSMYFARPVSDEPAKEPEPEHPAGPKPDPGEGYRILSKDPAEDLQRGDEYRCRREKQWIESNRVREGYLNQLSGLWYRRKIEQPKPPEQEYREPVLPADAGQYCQFSDDGIHWRSGWLNGWVQRGYQWISQSGGHWRHCRIKKES